MENRHCWQSLRIDYLIAFCSAIVVFCLVTNRVLWFAPIALAGAIFCGVSPRMSGPFRLSVGNFGLSGRFGEKTVLYKRARAKPDRESPGQTSSTRPPAD